MARGKSGDRVDRIAAKLRRDGLEHVRFELPDMPGSARSKQVPIEAFEQFARDGIGMYGGIIAVDTSSHVVPGSRYNEEVNYRDQILIPDWKTLAPVPWLKNTARVICDTEWAPGEPLRAAPRYVMGEMLKHIDKLGFKAVMSHEYEFYVLDRETRQPFFDGLHIFNNLRNEHLPVIREVVDYLRAAGLPMLTANAEYAPSQFELVYSHVEGMAGADNAYTFKNGVKEIVQQAGQLATFMTKPFAGSAGSGCHYHVSLVRKKGGRSAFIDRSKPDGMTDTLKYFVQGIIDHGAACMALFNPTPNCYRRLRPHTFAPSNISWGEDDRSAMVRIKAPRSKSMHVEMRAAAAISNPYLTAAGTLACGILGLKEKRKLGRQSDGPSEEDSSLPPFP
ncbi:MAG: Glutamate--isopropylamine ligase, partial [Alphaproteobacteria bacterium MarineAlpha10_Bin2]